MIETLFVRANSLARLLEPPLGSYLESLAQRLQGQSYSPEVIRSYAHAAHRFGEWLSKQGLALSAVNEQLIRRYVDQFDKRITPAHPYGQRPKLAQGLAHLPLDGCPANDSISRVPVARSRFPFQSFRVLCRVLHLSSIRPILPR